MTTDDHEPEYTDRTEWRSLGKQFDYRAWAARERFVELDKLIGSAKFGEGAEDPEGVPGTGSGAML